MKLKERLKAKETKLGKIFKTWVAYGLAFISALGACLEYVQAIPGDWVPSWLKITILISSLIARVGGQLTVDKKALNE
jgi:hypothetical protein